MSNEKLKLFVHWDYFRSQTMKINSNPRVKKYFKKNLILLTYLLKNTLELIYADVPTISLAINGSEYTLK